MARLNISAWAIRRPVPSLVLFMVLIALGVFSFQQLPVMRFPNIDIPGGAGHHHAQAGAAPSSLRPRSPSALRMPSQASRRQAHHFDHRRG